MPSIVIRRLSAAELLAVKGHLYLRPMPIPLPQGRAKERVKTQLIQRLPLGQRAEQHDYNPELDARADAAVEPAVDARADPAPEAAGEAEPVGAPALTADPEAPAKPFAFST